MPLIRQNPDEMEFEDPVFMGIANVLEDRVIELFFINDIEPGLLSTIRKKGI